MAEVTKAPPELALPPAVRRIGFVVIIGVIMAFLDATIVNVALRKIAFGLHMPLGTAQWTFTAYLLGVATTAPLTTWAVRRFGAKRVYLSCLAAFTIASVLCGLAQHSWELIAFRVAQGAASGVIGPAGQIILVTAAGPTRIARALAVFGVPVMLAPILGPPLGGLLVELAGWRWIFLVNLPIGLLGLWLGRRTLPADAQRGGGRFDITGFLLIAPSMVLLTHGLVESGETGRLGGLPAAEFIAGMVLFSAFAVRSLRVAAPLLDLKLYRNRAYNSASLNYFLMGTVIFGGTLIMPLWFQEVKHESVLATGLLLAPQGLGIAVTIWFSATLFARWGNTVVLVGATITLIATVPLAVTTSGTPTWWAVVVLTVRGLGIGLTGMPAMSAAYRALRPDQAGEASTQLNLVQRYGGSLGAATLAVVLFHSLAGGSGAAAAFANVFWTACVLTLLAVAPAALLVVEQRRNRSSPG